jgi:hypothetical protein
MRNFNCALLAAIFIILAGYSAAQATDYNVKFCFKYEIDYDDVMGGDF